MHLTSRKKSLSEIKVNVTNDIQAFYMYKPGTRDELFTKSSYIYHKVTNIWHPVMFELFGNYLQDQIVWLLHHDKLASYR